MASEAAGGIAASVIPWIGAPIGAAVDVYLAVTMTWRVGVLVSAYFQNGGFINGERKTTLEALKAVNPPEKFRLDDARPLGKQLREISRKPRSEWSTSLEEIRPEVEKFVSLSRPNVLDVVRAEVVPVNEHLVSQAIVVIDSLKDLNPNREKLFEVLTRTTGPGAIAIPMDVATAALNRASGLV